MIYETLQMLFVSGETIGNFKLPVALEYGVKTTPRMHSPQCQVITTQHER